MLVISDRILAAWGRTLNQDNETVKLGQWDHVSVECIHEFYTVHGNNKQVIDLHHYTELTQMKVAFGTFHYRPPPVLRLIAGATITRKSHLLSQHAQWKWNSHSPNTLYGIRYVRLSCRMTTATAADWLITAAEWLCCQMSLKFAP